MRHKMKRTYRVTTIGLLSVLLALSVLASAQQPTVNCPSDDVNPKAPKYRIGFAGHARGKDCELLLYISIDPGRFSREDMVALADRLNKDFCYEKRLTAIILDDYDAAKHPLRNKKAYWDAERGSYHLDRERYRQYIKFSTARGKPADEVVVNLDAQIK